MKIFSYTKGVICTFLLLISNSVFADWTDISSHIEITPSVETSIASQVLDRKNRVLFKYIHITNNTSIDIPATTRLVLVDLNDSVLNADGVNENGLPYFDITNKISANGGKITLRANFALSRKKYNFSVKLYKEGFIATSPTGRKYNPISPERIKADEPNPYVDGSFIVWANDGVSFDEMVDVATSFNATVQGVEDKRYMFLISKAGLNYAEMITLEAEIQNHPSISYATFNKIIKSNSSENDVLKPDSSAQYHFKDSKITDAWEWLKQKGLPIGSKNNFIGVIDSSYDMKESDLDTVSLFGCALSELKTIPEPLDTDFLEACNTTVIALSSIKDVVYNENKTEGENTPHGSFVTSIIASKDNLLAGSGVMQNAKILFSQINLDGNSEKKIYSDVYNSFSEMKKLGVKVINFSMGEGPLRVNVDTFFVHEEYCVYAKVFDYDSIQNSTFVAQNNVNSDGDCTRFKESKPYIVYSETGEIEIDGPFNDRSFKLPDSDGENFTKNDVHKYFSKFIKDADNFFADDLNLGESDLLIVQAAGNDNQSAEVSGFACSLRDSKLRENVLCVGAIKEETDGVVQVASFSNTGNAVDIFAPGHNITASSGASSNYLKNITSNDGTSFSAPIVTGVAGLINSAFPTLSAKEIRLFILNSSEDLLYGEELSGLKLNAYQALVDANSLVNNQLPIANAGNNQFVPVGDLLTLDGSSSTDDGGVVNYEWEVNGIVFGSSEPKFSLSTLPVDTYIASLIVTDFFGEQDTDTINVVVYDNQSDADHDGMPDVWEIANNLNPLIDDSLLGDDGDGRSNLQEYLDGTDPNIYDEYNPTPDIDRGLVAYYPFDGDASDHSGNGHNGTENGGVAYVEGAKNLSINFDGNYQNYIRVPHHDDLNIKGDYTFSYWVNRSTDSGPQFMISKGRDCNNSYYSAYGGQLFDVTQGNTWCDGTGARSDFNINEWHFVTVIINNSESSIQYYLDGQLESEVPIYPYSTTNNYDLVFGRHDTYNNGSSSWAYPYSGKLDEVRIYNRALTNVEITELYGLSSDEKPDLPSETLVFNSIEQNDWFASRAQSRNSENWSAVNVTDNYVMLNQDQTDNGPSLLSIGITPIDGKRLKISRKLELHSHITYSYQGGNEFFVGGINISSSGNSGKLSSDNSLLENMCQVRYYDYEYQGDWDTFFLNDRDDLNARVPSIWDSTFEEVFTYDPQTGFATYQVGSNTVTAYCEPLNQDYLRINMHTYGWWTGHYTKIFDFDVRWVDSLPSN